MVLTKVKVNKTVSWRQRAKEKLLDFYGRKCVDCGKEYPPFVMQFDHKNPSEKSFSISGSCKKYDTLLEETKKCDLVCSNCHHIRTHKQRCNGCKYCSVEQLAVQLPVKEAVIGSNPI